MKLLARLRASVPRWLNPPKPDPKWTEHYEQWKQRVAALPHDDPLWPGLLALLDQFILSETQAGSTPGLTSEEAHRFRGRIGMLLDLREEFAKLR